MLHSAHNVAEGDSRALENTPSAVCCPADDPTPDTAAQCRNLDELKQFFVRRGYDIVRQQKTVEELFRTVADIDYLEALAAHAERLVSIQVQMRMAADRQKQLNSRHTPTTGDKAQPMATFSLTPRGLEVPRTAWDAFLQGLVHADLVSAADRGGYLRLLGVEHRPLESPLYWGGRQQQLMLVFAALYGTLSYRSAVDEGVLRRGVLYTYAPLITVPAGGVVTDRRTVDPYCRILAAAISLPGGKRPTPRSLSNAKHDLQKTGTAAAPSTQSLAPAQVAKLLALLAALHSPARAAVKTFSPTVRDLTSANRNR